MKKLILAAAVFALSSSVTQAAIVLDFEGIAPYPNDNSVLIQNYYNGGTASNGNSGPNLGVAFSANSLLICLNSLSVTCSNTSRGGLAPTSAQGALFFLSGAQSIMNVAAGFDTGFSFNYASASQPGSVSVFDGLDGTGNLLATFALSPNATGCPAYGAGFCPFAPIGVSFAGIARSVSFAGVANQIVFDDITFGSATPITTGSVPEPATWLTMILGLGLTGAAIRRRRQQAAVRFAF
jgi:hypothetical protein